ncbi:unnamed protein product (mitochondrion) [Plasmodiophora brassicae]|uniref:PDZ domain-containing protein n=2 Tax=Plasmodiophora brassicae TaxID=37360 RepID=A0A3P3YFP2_PLABS|nr:unnamed protein product [Plasmodiophora brassicae]
MRRSLVRRVAAAAPAAWYLLRPRPARCDDEGAAPGPDYMTRAYEIASPAVVNIQCECRRFLREVAIGSGVIVGESGRVVTNAHVVANCSTPPVITAEDGRQFTGRLVGFDQMTDLALLQIVNETEGQTFPAVQFANSDAVRPGQIVLTIGSPLLLHTTVTHGIISAVQRQSAELGLSKSHRTDYIQTDAPINSGNSGGALVDLNGRLVGITTMKAPFAAGIGFAIPTNTVRAIIDQLEKNGRVLRPYLGFAMVTLTPAIIARERSIGDFPDVKAGVLVTNVAPYSPADRAGLLAGDVIVAVDGDPSINSVRLLLQHLGFESQRAVTFDVLRNRGQRLRLSVTPVPRE